jgi:hypothetical protein
VRIQESAEAASATLDRAPPESRRYRELAAEYAAKLATLTQSEDRLQETMRDYGRYLRQHGVRPEHIVICVRHALADAGVRQYADDRHLSNRALGWAIEGYYADAPPAT